MRYVTDPSTKYLPPVMQEALSESRRSACPVISSGYANVSGNFTRYQKINIYLGKTLQRERVGLEIVDLLVHSGPYF
jgi:hypothetical protein